jgi:hypothetical protein
MFLYTDMLYKKDDKTTQILYRASHENVHFYVRNHLQLLRFQTELNYYEFWGLGLNFMENFCIEKFYKNSFEIGFRNLRFRNHAGKSGQ